MASVDECCDVCVFEIEEEEELDPRIEDYLEILNNTSQEINLLESELDRARSQFRNLLGKSTQQLNASYEKLGKCVAKARPYYALLTESKEAQAEAHKAAVQFQRANSVYQVAKETVALAEERVTKDGARKDFDAAWQEMLNHATKRFTESEEEKARSEELHLAKALTYSNTKQKLDTQEKDMPKTIAKAKPYFDLKDRLEYALKQERQNVEDLQRALTLAKQKYKATLDSLENISESIHKKRRAKALSQLPPRTPGVGAESIYSQSSDTSDLPSINLDIISETSSGIYIDDDSVSLGSRVSVSRTPSGCSIASRTPGVGTCDLISQNGFCSSVCENEVLSKRCLGNASKKDMFISESVPKLGDICSGLTNNKITKTEAQMEPLTTQMEPLTTQMEPLTTQMEPLTTQMEPLTTQMEPLTTQMEPLTTQMEPLTTQMDDLNLSWQADQIKFSQLKDSQIEICSDNPKDCQLPSRDVENSHKSSSDDVVNGASGVDGVDKGYLENSHKSSSDTVVDNASGVICDSRVLPERSPLKIEDNFEALSDRVEVANGCDTDVRVGGTPQLQQLSERPPPQQLSERPPSQQLSERPPPQQLSERPPPQQLSERPPPQQLSERPPPQQLSERPPPQQLSERPPPQQLSERPPPQQLFERPPPQQLSERPPPQQLSERPPPQQLSTPPSHKKLRGTQFPILVGLSNCSRQPAPLHRPSPLAFYPPIPQPPQAVTLEQGRAQKLFTNQSADPDDQKSDKKNPEVEVFV